MLAPEVGAALVRPNQEKARRLQTNALAIHLNKRFLRVWLWRLKIKGVAPPKKSQDENTPSPHLHKEGPIFMSFFEIPTYPCPILSYLQLHTQNRTSYFGKHTYPHPLPPILLTIPIRKAKMFLNWAGISELFGFIICVHTYYHLSFHFS